MQAETKSKPTVAELFMRGAKLNIANVFISKSYFAVPKTKSDKLSFH